MPGQKTSGLLPDPSYDVIKRHTTLGDVIVTLPKTGHVVTNARRQRKSVNCNIFDVVLLSDVLHTTNKLSSYINTFRTEPAARARPKASRFTHMWCGYYKTLIPTRNEGGKHDFEQIAIR
jgi:hypothetical protein